MNKDFIESIIAGQQDEATQSFNDIMSEKLADALEVRKVEIASGIMVGEEVESIDEDATIRAWTNVHTKGSKAQQQKLDTVHAKNPKYQEFKKSLGTTTSAAKADKPAAKTAVAASAPAKESPGLAMRRINAERTKRAMELGKAHQTSGVGAAGTSANQSPLEKKLSAVTDKKPTTALGATPAERISALAKNKKQVGRGEEMKEEVEQIEEKSDQARRNKTFKNMMDASRGARWKRENKMGREVVAGLGDDKHKTPQAQNKAIGRALRSEENVSEVAEPGTTDNAKQLALHKRNLQVMNMAPTERSRVMTALKTHLAGRRLNVNQSSSLLGYLGKAGGLGDVNASVRNKVLKQGASKKDEV